MIVRSARSGVNDGHESVVGLMPQEFGLWMLSRTAGVLTVIRIIAGHQSGNC